MNSQCVNGSRSLSNLSCWSGDLNQSLQGHILTLTTISDGRGEEVKSPAGSMLNLGHYPTSHHNQPDVSGNPTGRIPSLPFGVGIPCFGKVLPPTDLFGFISNLVLCLIGDNTLEFGQNSIA